MRQKSLRCQFLRGYCLRDRLHGKGLIDRVFGFSTLHGKLLRRLRAIVPAESIGAKTAAAAGFLPSESHMLAFKSGRV